MTERTRTKLIGCMPVKNEDWILGLSARVALMWCDELVLLDNGSTDQTPDIIHSLEREYKTRVACLYTESNWWDDMTNRQQLLQAARYRKATHIAIVDADKILASNLLPLIHRKIEQIAPKQVLALPLRNLYHSNRTYRDDSHFQQWLSVAFQDSPDLYWKPKRDGNQYHHRSPYGTTSIDKDPASGSGVMHLQFARPRALKAKQAYYKMIEILRWPAQGTSTIDKRYSWWNNSEGMVLKNTPESWWAAYQPLLKHLNLSDNGNSWYQRECERLITVHGQDYFSGLDLFGVV